MDGAFGYFRMQDDFDEEHSAVQMRQWSTDQCIEHKMHPLQIGEEKRCKLWVQTWQKTMRWAPNVG